MFRVRPLTDLSTQLLDRKARRLAARSVSVFAPHARGRTAVFVSHRFSTVRDADWIVVLDSGRVIEQGTHDTLMHRQGRYARMFELQVARYRLSRPHDRTRHDSSTARTR